MDYSFYCGKKVLITGHTGFKGTWLSTVLVNNGAEVIGYSKDESRLFEICGIKKQIRHEIGDIRDFDHLFEIFQTWKPEIVFHLAAQPIVREGYKNPIDTYSTNVMGTVNVLECVRLNTCVKSFLNVTTDKVYENKEWEWGYRENDRLDGYDPYSNSKSCSDLITHCYNNSFFEARGGISASVARAGNVIGGGDFATDRIIPDCVRAVMSQKEIEVRNPHSIRPYQHVLEPIFAYLLIAARQYEDKRVAGYYNIGPNENDCIETGQLVDLFVTKWGEGAMWNDKSEIGPHEATYLKLDCAKIRSKLGWRPKWNIAKAVDKVVEWTKCYESKGDIRACMDKQICEYLQDEMTCN